MIDAEYKYSYTEPLKSTEFHLRKLMTGCLELAQINQKLWEIWGSTDPITWEEVLEGALKAKQQINTACLYIRDELQRDPSRRPLKIHEILIALYEQTGEAELPALEQAIVHLTKRALRPEILLEED